MVSCPPDADRAPHPAQLRPDRDRARARAALRLRPRLLGWAREARLLRALPGAARLLALRRGGCTWAQADRRRPGLPDRWRRRLAATGLPAGIWSVGAGMRFGTRMAPVGAHLWGLAVNLAAVPAVAWGLIQLFAIH